MESCNEIHNRNCNGNYVIMLPNRNHNKIHIGITLKCNVTEIVTEIT